MGKVSDLHGFRVYLDANVFIYHLEATPAYSAVVCAIFDGCDRGLLRAVTSELTLAEVLVAPLRKADQALVAAYEAMLTASPKLEVVPVDRAILVEASRLRAASSLRLPDAIHAATARGGACDAFVTNDAHLQSALGMPVALLNRLSA